MSWTRIARVLPVVLGCSGILAGDLYARGTPATLAASTGLAFAVASLGLLAALLALRQVGRATAGAARREDW